MTYDEIMEAMRPNFLNGDNVRVISARTGRDGYRDTDIAISRCYTLYGRRKSHSTHTFEVRYNPGDKTWRTSHVDWDNEYGVRHWATGFATEADALYHAMQASDYAMTL